MSAKLVFQSLFKTGDLDLFRDYINSILIIKLSIKYLSNL